eukprot:4367046-Prymnesium_polylepis.1
MGRAYHKGGTDTDGSPSRILRHVWHHSDQQKGWAKEVDCIAFAYMCVLTAAGAAVVDGCLATRLDGDHVCLPGY